MSRFILYLVLALISFHASAQQQPLTLIPQPVSVERLQGNFVLTSEVPIEISSLDQSLEPVASYLAARLAVPTGFKPKVNKVSTFTKGTIQLQLQNTGKHGSEGYDLNVTPTVL